MHALTSRQRQHPTANLANSSDREQVSSRLSRSLPAGLRARDGASGDPGHDFGLISLLPAPGGIQTKLSVSEPGDAYEREADSVAERVMRAPASEPPCACGGKCSECAGGKTEGEQGLAMRSSKAAPGARAEAAHVAGASMLAPSLGGGRPLSASDRAFFEPRFGWDFSRVRVHDGPQAARSAESLDARAYTLGNDIAFNRDEYQPGTDRGRKLLAHELAHVVQQNTVIGRQVVQRDLLPRDRQCDNMTSLPIHETGTLARGVYYTQTFRRPSSGKVRVRATSSDDMSCPTGSTFGVNMWQCHIISDDELESQHISPVGGNIDYEISLPVEAWNTRDQFTLRLRVNCDANDVDIRVDPA